MSMYMQANYSGPELEKTFVSISDIFPFKWFQTSEDRLAVYRDALHSLDIDGEEPYELMKYPLLLSCAESILSVLLSTVSQQDLVMWIQLWCYRCDVVHHRCLLGNPSPTLHKQIRELQESVEKEVLLRVNTDETWQWLLIRVLIEEGLFYLYTFETEKANPFFRKAMEYSGLEYEVTGVKGRRTKFQTFDTAQLIVYANSKRDENVITTATDVSSIPELIKLDDIDKDNILLESILVNADTAEHLKTQSKLSVMDQIIIQCLCMDIKNNNPKYGLITEQMSSYITRILAHPLNWTVYSYSLLLKSYVEYENTRTKERAILQLQVLVDQLSNETTPLLSNKKENQSNAPVWERLMYLYSTGFPPFWEMKKQLAQHYFDYGVILTALNIFKELQLYDDVVNCLEIVGRKEEAIQILQDRIHEKGETPYLVCRMGELQKNPKLLEHAWELSHHHFARAKRMLGDFYYEKNDFAACLPHYREALTINLMYPNTWFKCGVASMRTGDFNYAITCFTTLLKLNPEFGEGWSNLAGVLMKVGKMREAFEASRQSIRYLRENWRVWDNYVTISMAMNQYAAVIEGLKTILGMVQKNEFVIDYPLLTQLTQSILTLNETKSENLSKSGQTGQADETSEANQSCQSEEAEEAEEEVVSLLDGLEEEEGETKDRLKGSENDRQFLIKQLSSFFDELQKSFPRESKLYDLLYSFYNGIGLVDKALDALMKKMRSSMTGNYLASESAIKQVLLDCRQLLEFVISHEMQKKILEVKMVCRSVLSRSQRNYSTLDEYIQLKALVDSQA